MGSPIRVCFPDIMQAIEDKLVNDGVAGRSQVSWAVNNVLPQLNARFDILLHAKSDSWNTQDGGQWDFRLIQTLDIRIRSESIMDPGAGNKKWVREHFKLRDLVLNSVGKAHFFPKDANGNQLTILPVMAMRHTGPERRDDASTWGDLVCCLDIDYLPDVKIEKLVLPQPEV